MGGCGRERKYPVLDFRDYRNILVVKLDRIGDWVLCTPFLHAVRRNAPHAEITAVVAEPVLPLAQQCIDCDRVVALTAGGRFGSSDAGAVAAVEAATREAAFDLALVPRWDVDFNGASQVAAASRARTIVGFADRCSPRKRQLGPRTDHLYTHVLDHRANGHEVIQNLHLLTLFGCHPDRMPPTAHIPRVYVSERDEIAARGVLDRLVAGPQPIVGVAPFASEPKRSLSLERGLAICRLVSRVGAHVVIFGSETDRPAASWIAERLRHASCTCGIPLPVASALMRHLAAVVAVDSGPAHLAASVGTPVVVLSCHPAGGAADHENAPQRFAPWGDPRRVVVLQPGEATAPCQSACRAAEPHCILGIAPERIEREIESLLRPGARAEVMQSDIRPRVMRMRQPSELASTSGRRAARA